MCTRNTFKQMCSVARKEIRLLLRADPEGRYGFNIQGKERNQEEPVIVSKVMPDSSASLAYPSPLQLGDEIVQVRIVTINCLMRVVIEF